MSPGQTPGERRRHQGLRSPRLALRPADRADAALLHRHWNRHAVRRYLWDDEPVTEDTVLTVLARSDADFEAAGFGAWIVEDPDTGAFLGYCGLRVVDGLGAPEVLYSLEPEQWGKGLATEAASMVLDHAFDTLGLTRVLGGVDPPNEASRRVLERLGGHPIGDLVVAGRRTPYYELTPDAASPKRPHPPR